MAMLCRVTQDGQVIVESSDKMWSTGGGNGKLFQYSCHKNSMTMNRMKKQKICHWKMSPPGQKVSNMLLGKNGGQLLITLEE